MSSSINANSSAGAQKSGFSTVGYGHIVPIEEKKLRVHQNVLLAEYYKNRAKDPYELLTKLKELHDNHQGGDSIIQPAPHISSFNLPSQSETEEQKS